MKINGGIVHSTIPDQEYNEEMLGTLATKTPAVHLWWKRKKMTQMKHATHYYSQAMILDSSICSYFCTNGFHGGYFGIQEHKDYNTVHFSLWDGKGNKEQAKAIYTGEGVKASRFAHEGHGVKTSLQYNWNNYTTYHFLVQSERSKGNKAIYTAWFYADGMDNWFKMASIEALRSNYYLNGLYSFAENYCGHEGRRLSLNGPTWIKTSEGVWRQADVTTGTTTDSNAKNVKIFKIGEQGGIITGGPDFPNSKLSPLNLEESKLPCILSKVPGIEIDNSFIGHCI